MFHQFGIFVWILAAALIVWGGVTLAVLAFRGATVALTMPAFNALRDSAWAFVTFCLAIGGVTMAGVQITRMLHPFRGRFHRRSLEHWFVNSVEGLKPGSLDASVRRACESLKIELPSDPSQARSDDGEADRRSVSQLVLAALSDFESPIQDGRKGPESKNAPPADLASFLYDLPLEQLCGQLTVVSDLALDDPARLPRLSVCLAGRDGADDLAALVKAIGEMAPPKALEEQASDEAKPGPRSDDAASRKRGDAALAAAALKVTEVRAKMARTIQRRVDAFQIRAGGIWRRQLRGVVLIVSLIFSGLVTFSAMPSTGFRDQLGYIVWGALAGSLGAFIAMFFRDLTAIVELRRRQP
jgi:hypothetical protein